MYTPRPLGDGTAQEGRTEKKAEMDWRSVGRIHSCWASFVVPICISGAEAVYAHGYMACCRYTHTYMYITLVWILVGVVHP